MAISKIMHQNAQKHLKCAIEYICNPEKTEGGKWVGTRNCLEPYEDFIRTKQHFGKLDGRQGYHIVISFADEDQQKVTEEMTWKIAEEFAEKYLQEYETVFAVHNNTKHMHAHLIFNSINCVDGKKYHYSNGDWRKEIQPVVNDLCEKYGLATLRLDMPAVKESLAYNVWEARKRACPIWQDYERADINAAVAEVRQMSGTWADFLRIMEDKGYELRGKKRLSIKNPYREKGIRTDMLGDAYKDDVIRARINGTYIPEKGELKNPEQVETEIAQKPIADVSDRVISFRGGSITSGNQVSHAPVFNPNVQKRYAVQMYQSRRTYQKKTLDWTARKKSLNLTRLADDYAWMVKNKLESPERIREMYYSIKNKDASLKEYRHRLYYERKKCKNQENGLIGQLQEGKISQEKAAEQLHVLQQRQQNIEEQLSSLKQNMKAVYWDMCRIERIVHQDRQLSKQLPDIPVPRIRKRKPQLNDGDRNDSDRKGREEDNAYRERIDDTGSKSKVYI